jgi:hypothetical protein
MDTITLALTFMTSVAVAGCVVAVFSKTINDLLSRLLIPVMADAWSLYAKFAIFTASFAGGMHVHELLGAATEMSYSGSQPTFSAHRALLEIFRSMIDALQGASWALMACFAAAFGASVAIELYRTFKPTHSSRVSERNLGIPVGRH